MSKQTSTTINLDLLRPGIINMYAKQYDTLTRTATFRLISGGQPFLLDEGATVSVQYVKPDGTRGFYDSLPNKAAAVTVTTQNGGSILSVVFAPQMFTVAGKVRCSIALFYATGEKLQSFSFALQVEAAEVTGDTSADYYNLQTLGDLSERLERVEDMTAIPRVLLCENCRGMYNGHDMSGTTMPEGAAEVWTQVQLMTVGGVEERTGDIIVGSNGYCAILGGAAGARTLTGTGVKIANGGAGLPIASAALTGNAYAATGDDLPVVVPGSGGKRVGKGLQIVMIPIDTNREPSPTLALNGGAAVEIRRRSPGPKPGEALPPETTALPARALRRGVPYTMTFCGLYWLLDSAVADDGLPTEWMPVLDKLTNLIEGDVVGVPIVNSMDDVPGDAAIAFIRRAAAETTDEAISQSGGNVTLPTVGRVGELIAAAGQTYTTLERTRQHLRVHCHGLETGRTYTLHLYTVSRKNGRRQGQWYHPDNYDDVPSGGGIGRRVGYARLAGKRMYDFDDGTVFPPVPEWMPNGGFLETEWAVHAEGETAEVTVDLTSWILPMLKPNGNVWETSCMKLIGVSKATCAPLLLRICLSDEAGAVYPCRDTLRLGAPIIQRYGEERDFYLALSPHYIGVQTLYCSIS